MKYAWVPLLVTRQAAYLGVVAGAVVAVLLPVSVMAYFNFYKMLVPSERFALTTHFTGSPATAIVDPSAAISFLQQNKDLLFLVRLNLRAICRVEQQYHQLQYVFALGRKWEDYFIVNCDLRYIYTQNNHWVPYNLRFWVPPIAVDIFRFVRTDWRLAHFTGRGLLAALEHTPSISLHVDDFLLVDPATTLDLVIEWDGLRYYLVNYFGVSAAAGIVFFWALLSCICLVSAVHFWQRFSSGIQ